MPKSISQKTLRRSTRYTSHPTLYRVVRDDSCFPLVGKVFTLTQIKRAWQAGIFQTHMEFVLQPSGKRPARYGLSPGGELTEIQ